MAWKTNLPNPVVMSLENYYAYCCAYAVSVLDASKMPVHPNMAIYAAYKAVKKGIVFA